jgi:hypothetical protein
MVQTANAAATQTVIALPPPSFTPTFTPTPRSTFTPVPSFTPVQPYLFPSPTPMRNLGFYRVKHDQQLAMYNYKARSIEGPLLQTPEILPMYLLPKLTSGTGRSDMSGRWENFINALNEHNEAKLRFLKSYDTALFNTNGFPQMESLTMGGNIITLELVQGEWARVRTLDYNVTPNLAEVNYVTRPDLIHKFVLVVWNKASKSTTLANPRQGVIYYPFVSKRPVWVQMNRLEPFPILPMQVTANEDIYIQNQPGPAIEATSYKVAAGETRTIVEYYPSASDVWGRLQTGGWIPLIYKHKYKTSWSMQTIPPP